MFFEAGSEIDRADRELRHAAHVYHVCKDPARRNAARQALRKAAILFAAAAQDLLPKKAA